MNRSRKPLLLVILGPTGTGKSSLALNLAASCRGEIVNCDSMQTVRGFDIGTAKPSLRDRNWVAHHLYDIVDPEETFSAGSYMVRARRVCREIAERGGTPIVAGGTGLYLRVLLEGIFPGPGREPDLRERLRRVADRKGNLWLHSYLAGLDPEAADGIEAEDRLRTIRALEVILLTGEKMSRLQARREPLEGFRVVRFGIGIPRAELYGRIDRRVVRMFSEGLLQEVREHLESGISPRAKAFEALGYRQAFAHLAGWLDWEEAVRLTQRDTRRYAKRQMTWFRKEPGVTWLNHPGESRRALENLLLSLFPELG